MIGTWSLIEIQFLIFSISKWQSEIKSFDTTSLMQDYQRYLSIAKANDKGSATLSFAPYPAKVLIGWANIPDTGYGS